MLKTTIMKETKNARQNTLKSKTMDMPTVPQRHGNDESDTWIGLAHCSLFNGLSLLEDLKNYCSSAKSKTYAPKERIYFQGNPCSDLFIVLCGQVKLTRSDAEGNEFTMGLFSMGELFGPGLGGTDALIAQETAMSTEPTILWQTPATEFHRLLFGRPDLCLRVVKILVKRQQQAERRLLCLAFRQTEARLAETLRELSGGFAQHCEHGFGQHLRITQQELADLVGASRPVVSTILNRLRKAGVLGYSREYLCVKSFESIERMIGD
jgi:CRP/FNR family transcriptional regulator, cyclic AMP receptor protein